jgi:exodeoxyribonuclease-3
MRVVTWNVNSLKVRLPRVLEFLAEHAPDVVCLQETKTEADAFPHAQLADAGYAAVDHSGGRWAGVAILAPAGVPLALTARGLPGEATPEEARWVEASVDGLRVASVYVPNGRGLDSPEFPRKLAFLDAMRARAETGELDMVAGDLNVTAADVDVYDPAAFLGSTHVTPEERERLRGLESAGLVDAYRAVHGPDAVGFTWWDYRQGHFHRKLGLRIDYLLLGERLAGRVRGCGIDRGYRKGPKPSDHAPLLAELADA